MCEVRPARAVGARCEDGAGRWDEHGGGAADANKLGGQADSTRPNDEHKTSEKLQHVISGMLDSRPKSQKRNRMSDTMDGLVG